MAEITEQEVIKAVDTLLKSCRRDNDSFGLETERVFTIGDTRTKFIVKVDIREYNLCESNEWVNIQDEDDRHKLEEDE